jgi:hypothetical protein
VPFETPRASEVKETDNALAGASSTVDLTPHLTNTCLQLDRGEEGVRLLSELVGCRIISVSEGAELGTLTNEHVEAIIAQIGDVLAETFRAALQTPVHFQVRRMTCCIVLVWITKFGIGSRFRMLGSSSAWTFASNYRKMGKLRLSFNCSSSMPSLRSETRVLVSPGFWKTSLPESAKSAYNPSSVGAVSTAISRSPPRRTCKMGGGGLRSSVLSAKS